MSSPSKTSLGSNANREPNSATIDFIEQVRVNQEKLTNGTEATLRPHRLRVRLFRFARTIKISTAEIIWPIQRQRRYKNLIT